jgi:undecaprenyl-diphosphatase
MFNLFLPFDGAVAQWIARVLHPASNPFWDAFFSLITRLGDGGLFWIALALLLLLPNKTRKVGAVMVGALVLDVILTNGLLKPLFQRPRPYDIDFVRWARDYVYPNLTHMPHDASFPSGHTAVSFAGAAGLLLGARKAGNPKNGRLWGWLAAALAALVGFSRIYLGVHYATDVLSGFVVGVACARGAFGVFLLIEKIFDKCNAPVAKFVDAHFPKLFRS